MFLNCQKFWFPNPTWIQGFWIREWRPISPSVISNTAQFRRTWTPPLGKVRLQREEKWAKRAKGVHFYSHKNSHPRITTPGPLHLTTWPGSSFLLFASASWFWSWEIFPIPKSEPVAFLFGVFRWSLHHGLCSIAWQVLMCCSSHPSSLPVSGPHGPPSVSPTLSDSLRIPALSSLDAKPGAVFPSCSALPAPACPSLGFVPPPIPSYSVSLIWFGRLWWVRGHRPSTQHSAQHTVEAH